MTNKHGININDIEKGDIIEFNNGKTYLALSAAIPTGTTQIADIKIKAIGGANHVVSTANIVNVYK